MGQVIPFPQRQDLPDNVWVCDCGCDIFVIGDDKHVYCLVCEAMQEGVEVDFGGEDAG